MKKIHFYLFLILTISVFSVLGCSKDDNKKSLTESYSITISPTPDAIQYGAYGILTASVYDNVKQRYVVNPEVLWTVTNDFGTFDNPTSASTVFRAKDFGGGASTQEITVTYNTATNSFRKKMVFIGGNVSGSGNIWVTGPNSSGEYTISITSPTANEFFVAKGAQATLKAVVKDSKGQIVNNPIVKWSVPEGVGTFSSQTAETIFTAGTNNYNGDITVEYMGVVQSKKTLIIGDSDGIFFIGLKDSGNTIVKNGRSIHVDAIVTSNGYILESQPNIQWKSSNSQVQIIQNPSGGVDLKAYGLTTYPVTITATVSGTSISNSVPITVKDIYFIYKDTIRLTSDMKIDLIGGNCVESISELNNSGGVGDAQRFVRTVFKPNEAGSGILWPMREENKDMSDYSKIIIYVRGQTGDMINVHFMDLTYAYKTVTLTSSWQKVEVNKDEFSTSPYQSNHAFSITLVNNKESNTIVDFDYVYFN